MSARLRGRERRNVSGQAYALTLLSPVPTERVEALRDCLQALRGRENPLLGINGTHFARWVIVDEVNYDGKGAPPQLPFPYLLFTSVFDRSLAHSVRAYLTGLCQSLPDHVDAIWSHCLGYPGGVAENPERFAAWVSAHQVHSGLFFAAYGDATVEQVREALDRRRRFREFVTAHAFSAPEAIQSAFGEAFADLEPTP